MLAVTEVGNIDNVLWVCLSLLSFLLCYNWATRFVVYHVVVWCQVHPKAAASLSLCPC